MDFLEAGHIIAYFIIGVLCFKRSAPIPAPALLRRLITPSGFHVSALFQFSVFSNEHPAISRQFPSRFISQFCPRLLLGSLPSCSLNLPFRFLPNFSLNGPLRDT